jgi:hypothetical protein
MPHLPDPADGLPSATRRRLCQIVGAFFLGLGVSPGQALAAAPALHQRATVAAFLDILFPRDAISGSATDLGVHDKLLAFSQGDENFARLLDIGSQWLNMTGSEPFAGLPDDQKTAIVTWMSESDWNQIPRRFYELVRQIAIELYFSQPASWVGLPIHRPPQPFGYPPPWV